jgi:hypothetical protein
MREIMQIITNDAELLELYHNDPHFHATIENSILLNMGVRETLVCAIKTGYKAKKEMSDNYLEHLQLYGNNKVLEGK